MTRQTLPRILACFACLTAASGAGARDFGAWRPLTPAEEKARIGDTPPSSVDPSTIEADFDGDGRKDLALIAFRKADGMQDLIVDMGGRVHVLVRSEPGGEGITPDAGLGFAKPGRWETICGNAFRDLQPAGMCDHYPGAVTLKHPGIICITDGATSLYYWDSEKKTFDSVVLAN